MASQHDASNTARQVAPIGTPPERVSGPPPLIPDHQLLRCIGRGSYGEVWLARNVMGTYRAVKIVYRASFAHERPFERELSGILKFEPISRSHEGFVDVLHVGRAEAQGCFYYIMEVGDDELAGQIIDAAHYSPKTLAKEISRRGRLSFQECLELGLALSMALAELHKHKLVHRDIKPSNIIFVNGVPKLADIGLVAEVSEAQSYVGTEGFIPPEGPGSPSADVYGLGKVLYEAATGKDRQDFPELPDGWWEAPDKAGLQELNEVILQACRNQASGRYPSAWDMHADLVVLANGKSVKRLRILEQRLKTLKRAAGIAGLALALLGLAGYQFYRERKVRAEALQRQVGANIAYGNQAMQSGYLLEALPHFANAWRLDRQGLSAEAAHRRRFATVQAQCPKLTRLWSGARELRDGQLSPDAKRLVVAEDFGEARIYEVETGERYARQFPGIGGLVSAAYSPDGRWIVTGDHEGKARIWDAEGLNETRRLAHPDGVFSAKFSPDGTRIVTGCGDGFARVWEAQTGRLDLQLGNHTNAVAFAAFSRDGRLIVTASRDSTARIWAATNGHPVGPPLPHRGWVRYADFSPDGQRVITACEDHKARVWEVGSGRRVLPDLGHQDVVSSAEFSPDGRLILTAGYDGVVRLWLADTLQPIASNSALRHGERVTHACFSPEGRRIITTCTDGSARIWDLAGSALPPVPTLCSYSQDASRLLVLTNGLLEIRDGRTRELTCPAINPGATVTKGDLSGDGRFVLGTLEVPGGTVITNHRVQVWHSADGSPVAPALLVSNWVAGVSLSRDGTRLVCFGTRRAQAWDVLGQRPLFPPWDHPAPVRAAVFSPDGARIASRGGQQVWLWNAANGQPACPPLKHSRAVQYAEFSPDSTLLATCCSDDQLTKCYAQVWNVITGQPHAPPLKHADGVLRVAFSPDGKRVVTASEDFTAVVWDVATGRQLAPALHHENQILSAAFSPDSKWVVTISADRSARVWSAETGDPLSPPLRHLAPPREARFLPGLTGIVTLDKRGRAWVWDLPTDQRPVADAVVLAQLLSGGPVDTGGSPDAGPPGRLQEIWRQLRVKYPFDFSVSAGEICAWHEFEAEESELQQQWFAAAFHLERLLLLRPGDPAVAKRLAEARHRAEGGS